MSLAETVNHENSIWQKKETTEKYQMSLFLMLMIFVFVNNTLDFFEHCTLELELKTYPHQGYQQGNDMHSFEWKCILQNIANQYIQQRNKNMNFHLALF